MVPPGFTQRRGKALAALLALAAVFLGGWVDPLNAQSNYATPYTFSTLAGYDVNEGAPPGAFSNGTGPAAQFNQPFGITVDSIGNLYVADTINCLIRKITSEGVVTTFAGAPGVQGSSDSTDGTGSTARFENPHGIAVDASGNLYVADTYNCTIRKITPSGDVTTLAGSPGVAGSSDSTDGTGSTARFNYPFGIAVDTNGNLYVADTYNCTIRKITPSGDVTTLAGSPRVHGSSDSTDGTGSTARFNSPYGIAVDTSGNVYVADSNNFTIRKITPAGNVTTLAGSPGVSGSTDGTGSAALFGDEQNDGPCGVTVDVGGNLYVADTDNATLRKITQEGIVTTLAGNAGYRGGTDGAGSGAFFNLPTGITVDASGILYVADLDNSNIRKGIPPVTPPTSTVVAASNITATSAQLNGMVNAFNGNTTAVFQYGTDPNFSPGLTTTVAASQGTLTNGVPAPVSVTVNGLTDGVTYYYQISATNSVGTTVSGVSSFIPFTNPSAAIGAATPVSTTSVQVSGAYNAQGTSTQVYFRYGTDPTMTAYSNIPASPTTATGYANTIATALLNNLAQDTTYYYQLTNLAGTVTSGIGSFQTTLLSGFLRQFPNQPPAYNGSVQVNITPTNINPSPGWNFVGEQLWRPSGVPVTGLVTGTYNIEYQPAPGYIQPSPESISVTSGTTTTINGQYVALQGGATGGMSVVLEPQNLAGAQWQILGQTQWYNSGAVVTGLAPGNYLVQCAPASNSNYITPPVSLITVQSGLTPIVYLTYVYAGSPSGELPSVLPSFSTVTSSATPALPYAFVGQIRSDLGSATGFVVENRVVATAAHVVFDDGSLSYVTGLLWLFQRFAGTYEPVPQIPQGSYVLSGYAAERATEPNPGESTLASQNLDAAALYFMADAGNGGYSGYLASDSSPNEFLTSSNNKILVGYPIDGEPAANQGQMWATAPINANFTQVLTGNDNYGNPYQVYTTSDLASVGGNSGGPLCVQYNGSNTQYDGNYYPAAIYLGGSEGQTSVRAIDSNVVALFTAAEISGEGGANNTSGGITQANTGITGGSASYAGLQVYFEPAAATGASWGTSSINQPFSNGFPDMNIPEGDSPVTLYVTPVAGYLTPAPAKITLTGGDLSTVTVTYQLAQTISFPTIATRTLGTAPFTLNATGSSGLAVTYSVVSGPATISGNTVTLTGVGTVVLAANQAGNANYAAAPQVTVSFTVNAAQPATDTPIMPPWALALLAMLLFVASSRQLREKYPRPAA